MERSQLFDLMGELQLYGMKSAFDEIMATAVKRQHEPQQIIGDLLAAEINEKQARSIKYQLTVAKLPLAKVGSPIISPEWTSSSSMSSAISPSHSPVGSSCSISSAGCMNGHRSLSPPISLSGNGRAFSATPR